MICISPLTLRNSVTGIFNTVPCGKCVSCLTNKRNDWSFRISQEHKVCETAYFVTLTYDKENVSLINVETGEINEISKVKGSIEELISDKYLMTLDKNDVQLFLKRLRKKNDYMYKKYPKKGKNGFKLKKQPKIRYYCVGEYGEKTKRPHYHMILFNLHVLLKDDILNVWKKGNVQVGTVTAASIHYTTKYMLKKDIFIEGTVKPFSLMSKGLGYNYVEDNRLMHRNLNKFDVVNEGVKQRMPRYYKQKIFSDLEIKINGKEVENEVLNDVVKKENKLRKKGINPEVRRMERIENYKKLIEKRKKEKI